MYRFFAALVCAVSVMGWAADSTPPSINTPQTLDVVLAGNGAGVQNSFRFLSAASITSGTLGVARGGTGLATLTAHALQVGNGTSAITQLALPTESGQILQGQPAGFDPVWGSFPTLGFQGGNTGGVTLKGGTSGRLVIQPAAATAQIVNITTAAQTTGTTTLTIPDMAGSSDTFSFLTKAETLTSKTLTAPVINGATSSGSTAIDFSGNNGAFKTTTGHITLEGVTSTGATGSGKFVFDTSPTLVTPLLGTPTSGNLSNCTALNATQLTSGTVPAARFPPGSVVQVILFQLTVGTEVHTTSSTYQATGLTATITPVFSTSKIKIEFTTSVRIPTVVTAGLDYSTFRGATNLFTTPYAQQGAVLSNGNQLINVPISPWCIDTPGAGTFTYTIKFNSADNATDVIFLAYNQSSFAAFMQLTEIAQ